MERGVEVRQYDAIDCGVREYETPARNGRFLADVVESMRATNGGVLRLRPGIYHTDAEWLWDGVPNLWLDGKGAKLVYEGPAGGRLLTVTSRPTQRCEFVRVDGLWLDGGARTSGVLNVFHGAGNNVQTSLSRLRIENSGPGDSDYGLVIGEGGDQLSPYTQVSEFRLRDSTIVSRNQIHCDGRFANVLRMRDTDIWGDGTGTGIRNDAAGPLDLDGCTAGMNALDLSLSRDLNVAPWVRISRWHSESSARFFAQHGTGRATMHMTIREAAITGTSIPGGFRVSSGGYLSVRDSQLSTNAEPGIILEPDGALNVFYDASTFAQNAFGFIEANGNVIFHGSGASSNGDEGYQWLGSLGKGLHYDQTLKTVTVRP